MSNNDWSEYEHFLAASHQLIDHPDFEAEWAEGFTLTIDQILDDLNEWSSAQPTDQQLDAGF